MLSVLSFLKMVEGRKLDYLIHNLSANLQLQNAKSSKTNSELDHQEGTQVVHHISHRKMLMLRSLRFVQSCAGAFVGRLALKHREWILRLQIECQIKNC